MNKKTNKKTKDPFPNDKATHEWLDLMKKTSRCTYKAQWKHFLEFTGKTGDQILAERKTDKNYAWEKKVIQFRQWLLAQGLSEHTAKTAGGVARGFFGFHRMELKFRRTESARLTEARRKTEDYRFSRNDLKRMADIAGLEEKYVVIAGKSFGLRAGDFLALTRGDLKPYINREVPIPIGEYGTQKESVNAYPFIDGDAQPIIKLMLENMDRQGRTKTNDRMLTYNHTIRLTRILKRIAEKANIEHGNKIIRFHCLRKFLIDRLSSHMSTEKWKQIVGKKISEGAYVSPDSLQTDYKRAMEETVFVKAGISESELRIKLHFDGLRKDLPAEIVDRMEAEYRGQDPKIVIPESSLEARAVKRITDREGIDMMEGAYMISKEAIKAEMEEIRAEQRKGKRKQSNNCHDGNCQRIVAEDELSPMLAEGWHVAAVLPSGKIVVSNDVSSD